MTILSTITKQSFECNGSLREFDFNFTANSADDIKALIRDAAGDETELTVTAQYSVTLNTDGSGGTLTTVATWATGNTLIVYRKTDHTQETAYKNNNTLDQEVLANDLDKMIMIAQETDEKVNRALIFPMSDPVGSVEIPSVSSRANRLLAFDADGELTTALNNSLDHNKVTVSAPLSITDQAIKLVNDADATVTEIDTGVVADSDTVIPTSKAVKTAIAAIVAAGVTFATAAKITEGLEAAEAIAPDQLKLSSPTFANITDSGLTASQMVYTDADKKLISKTFDKARAYRNAAQSIPNNIFTKIAINTTTFDPAGIVDTTNHRIKPTKAGYYQLSGQVSFQNIIGNLFCILFKNGSEYSRGNRMEGNGDSYVTVSDIIYFNGSTDYVELCIYQNSGATKDLEVGTTGNYLSIVGPF